MKKDSTEEKKPNDKNNLHPRNAHRSLYDFVSLVKANPSLRNFIFVNEFNTETIDFSNASAVKELNKSLLNHFYKISYWDIPEGYLCPPIPGRADYIHYLADLLAESNNGRIPKGEKIKILDIGVGANCVYPIIGKHEYDWNFIGSEIDSIGLRSAQEIVNNNGSLKTAVEIRRQTDQFSLFENIIKPGEKFEAVICNPPFHSSPEEAAASNQKKNMKLTGRHNAKVSLNFSGKNSELWCKGGEQAFAKKMVVESKNFEKNCLWFSILISKKYHLDEVYRMLKHVKAEEVKTIQMSQGQKISRIVAWTYHNKENREQWFK